MRQGFLLAAAAAMLLSGCGAGKDAATGETNHPAKQAAIEQEQAHEMPDEMPADFNFRIRYGYGLKDEIDTYERKVVKDLVAGGTAEAEIALSDSEMHAVYAKMKAVNAMRLTDLNVNRNCAQIPFNQASWTITAAGETKTLTWSSEHCGIAPDAKKLLELQTYIAAIIGGKAAYKALPAAQGGYD